jgi:hypothetical protein
MPVIATGVEVHDMTINSGATVTLSGSTATLNVTGSFINNGTFNASTSIVSFNGTSTQTIPAGTYGQLEINNANGVNLGDDLTVTDTIFFTSGTLSLGNNDLTVGSGGVLMGADETKFIVTDGSGSLRIDNIGIAPVIFPVGPTAVLFNPLTITNAGTVDQFSVLVVDDIVSSLGGATIVTNDAVNRTWFIEEGTVGGSNADITVQWSSADEGSGFDRANSYVSHFDGGAWVPGTTGVALGSDPYTQTMTGVTSFSPFGVGSGTALPVDLISFNAALTGKSVATNWSTASEINSASFIVERSADNKSFEAVATVKASGTTNSISNYASVDAQAVQFASAKHVSTLYYRLRQVDVNGAARVYNSMPVSMAPVKAGVTASPNPFVTGVKLTVLANTTEKYTITVTDFTGKQVATLTKSVDKGENTIVLDELNEVHTGVYFIQVISANETQTIKVVKE